MLNVGWEFALQDSMGPMTQPRLVTVPHDWSIEGTFDADHPAGVGGGALPGGVGVYTRILPIDRKDSSRRVFLEFDGVYQNSTVFVNDQQVGYRPNGYISFSYDITPFLDFGKPNALRVEVDNSQQPNSRWYSGSGIYRSVRMVKKSRIFIPQYGLHLQPVLNEDGTGMLKSTVAIDNLSGQAQEIEVELRIMNTTGEELKLSHQKLSTGNLLVQNVDFISSFDQINTWSTNDPYLYTAQITLLVDDEPIDQVTEQFGFRSIRFDVEKGFFLNGQSMKIKGVCMHHDLGALGAAFNRKAMERQLQIMKEMGVNAIRTSHNPPDPNVLELCDSMGIMVMDEMFDMWSISKSAHDYAKNWKEWHERDLADFIKRDRNHPSVVIWSIGNEIMEQYNHSDSLGGKIARELIKIVQELDKTRPITTGNNDPSPDNTLIKNGGMQLIGYNYQHPIYKDFQQDHPGKSFIATETNSALATRGYYEFPSDTIRIWPEAWDKPFTGGHPDHKISAYDHVRVPWGSLQEETWPIIRSHDFMSGMFIWTGFDYLGEPTPYGWPSRSSYFGLVDLAGFPKDTYYYYQSEWSTDTVLHLFPHWNWTAGQEVDLWAYYNYADQVELFLNDQSLGAKAKKNSEGHVMWRVPFQPGVLKAVSSKEGKVVKKQIIQTAGVPTQILLDADRTEIRADGLDLSFIKVSLLDENGIAVPHVEAEVSFEINGAGIIRATDNGDPVDHTSFQSPIRNTMGGKCLVIIQSTSIPGLIQLTANAKGLQSHTITIQTK